MRKEKGEYTYPFPRPSVTTDCVIFGYDGKDLKLLLVERGIPLLLISSPLYIHNNFYQ